jgi:hypothetical protein
MMMNQKQRCSTATVVPLKPAKSAKGKEVAKPYEPTPREAETLASYEKRKAKKVPAPGMKVKMIDDDGKSVARMEVDHPDASMGYKLLSEAVGSENGHFLRGTLDSLAMAAQTSKGVDEANLNYGLAMVRGLHPRDQLEATLGVQMAAIHIATMTVAARLGRAETVEAWDMNERALNRLTRTFAAQMEALKRYRSNGEQQVYVERVTVNEGGQAIVGPVTHGGRDRGGEENGD